MAGEDEVPVLIVLYEVPGDEMVEVGVAGVDWFAAIEAIGALAFA